MANGTQSANRTGKLSQIFGKVSLSTDRTARTFGLLALGGKIMN